MNDLSDLLTVPGNYVMSLLAPLVADDDEARMRSAETFGYLFWMALVVVAGLGHAGLRTLRARWAARPPGQDLAGELRAAGDDLRRRASAVAWPVVWGAAWRAQVVHVVLYAAIPLLWEGARLALFIVFLPFTVMSFADQPRGASDGTLDHLARPACWTFVGICPGPRSHFLHDTVIEASTCVTPGNCAPGSTRVPDTGGWLWKALWAVLSVAWIRAWRRRQRRAPEDTRRR